MLYLSVSIGCLAVAMCVHMVRQHVINKKMTLLIAKALTVLDAQVAFNQTVVESFQEVRNG
jgi:hypothetical protein